MKTNPKSILEADTPASGEQSACQTRENCDKPHNRLSVHLSDLSALLLQGMAAAVAIVTVGFLFNVWAQIQAKKEARIDLVTSLVVENATQKAVDYRRIVKLLGQAQSGVANLMKPCPLKDEERCVAHYRELHTRLGDALDQLNVEIPVIFGSGSNVGMAVDNAYGYRTLMETSWYENDRYHARCMVDGDNDQKAWCRNLRRNHLQVLSVCINHAACVVADNTQQVDDAMYDIQLEVMGSGEPRGEGNAVSRALDKLHDVDSDGRAACPKSERHHRRDEIVERVCASTAYHGSGRAERIAVLREIWPKKGGYPFPLDAP